MCPGGRGRCGSVKGIPSSLLCIRLIGPVVHVEWLLLDKEFEVPVITIPNQPQLWTSIESFFGFPYRTSMYRLTLHPPRPPCDVPKGQYPTDRVGAMLEEDHEGFQDNLLVPLVVVSSCDENDVLVSGLCLQSSVW